MNKYMSVIAEARKVINDLRRLIGDYETLMVAGLGPFDIEPLRLRLAELRRAVALAEDRAGERSGGVRSERDYLALTLTRSADTLRGYTEPTPRNRLESRTTVIETDTLAEETTGIKRRNDD